MQNMGVFLKDQFEWGAKMIAIKGLREGEVIAETILRSSCES